MALLIGAALLVAQLVNFALILNERQKLSLAQNQGPAITRYAAVASDLHQAPAEFRFAVLEDASRRGARFEVGRESAVAEDAGRDAAIEARLTQTLSGNGVPAPEVRAQIRGEPLDGTRRARGGRGAGGPVLLLSARYGEQWLNGRLLTPRPDPWLTHRLGAATLALYLIVLGATLFVAMRLARPLRDLARAAEGFAGRGTPEAVAPRGPADLRRAIEAFNAMNDRVVALLDEKDRMLGAIGHDLRTPLASLRIRAESMEPETERRRIAATIDEMTAMLEDILVLARSGRDREEARAMDVTALVDALVEEFRELGEDVEMEEGARQVLTIRPNLLRRAVRNLIENAVKYGGAARLDVRSADGKVRIEVRDRGPGIPETRVDDVLQPFARIEESRNRETGGSGLGLAIAKAAAESHGGTLQLRNAAEGGLIAALVLPA
ncbi:ATP-binding protein [Sphingosinicella sp. BN140058]|uniref:sensor histidine kinase n=1 Tax=Sphingosinicella sp. BN140058 TaxID=1892855 RepID=UPI0010109CE2|nr:ATP-binding protein [Sphingosinicella sp. BN140058]QAY80076.1 HAMP domain-containing protein [Sphingosinicella sp. BN140058]